MIIYRSPLYLQILCCIEAFKHVRESRKDHAINRLGLLGHLLNAPSKFSMNLSGEFHQISSKCVGNNLSFRTCRRKSATEMNVLMFEGLLLFNLGSDINYA